MSLTTLARSRSRVALGSVLGLVVGVALAGAIGAPADAAKPDGSRIPIQVETGSSASGDPSQALTSGWWGHEGGANNGTGTGSTFLSLDASNGTGAVDETTLAATLTALGAPDLDHVGYAIVPTTADGSNEDPTATVGQNAATVFNAGGAGRVLYLGFGGALNGSANANDSVTIASSKSEVEAWVAAGRPLQTFNNSLQMVDISSGTVSATPQGRSILNSWPAGTHLSLVAYVTDGMDPALDNQVPLVAVEGGKAKTAWMPFTTVAKPGDALRTSAGYQVTGAYAPTLSTAATYTSTGASLRATVKNNAAATASDASGNIEFAQVVGGVRSATTVLVPTSGGTATFSLPGFTSGTRIYDARYVPDGAASATYLTSDWKRTTMTAPIATKTSLSVVGGSTYDTLTATVSPKVAGIVRFYDGSTLIKSLSLSTSTGKAIYKKLLSARKHTLKATFTPTSSAYKSSSYTRSVYKPTISITKSPSTVKHGTHPKLTIKVVASGTSVSGTITITYDPASGSTKHYTLTLAHGAKAFTLPTAVKGTTRITVKYNGHSPVLAASKSYSYKVY